MRARRGSPRPARRGGLAAREPPASPPGRTGMPAAVRMPVRGAALHTDSTPLIGQHPLKRGQPGGRVHASGCRRSPSSSGPLSISRHSTSYRSSVVRTCRRRSSRRMRARGSLCPVPAKRRSGAAAPGVPVDDRLFPLHHADPAGTWVGAGLGQRETYPEAADQKARAARLLQHAERSADHEPFRAAVRGVHQETAVRDDLEALSAAAQRHFAVGPVTPLDELNGLDSRQPCSHTAGSPVPTRSWPGDHGWAGGRTRGARSP